MIRHKLLHIILTLVFTISTTGLAISKHYCGTELVEISIQHKDNNCCNADNCCSNEIEVFKLGDNFLLSTFSLQTIDVNSDITFHVLDQVIRDNEKKGFFIKETHSPPFYSLHTFLAILQVYIL